MKKLASFLILFILTISAFAQDGSLFIKKFLLVNYSGNNNHCEGSSILKISYLNETTYEEKYKWIPRTESRIKPYGSRIDHSETMQVDRKGFYSKKPPLNPARIAGEILLGGLLGFAGSLSANYAGGGGVGLLFGAAFGSSIGVYIIGQLGNETGSYPATLFGSIIGTGAFFLYAQSISIDENIYSFFITLGGFPAIGGTLFFNLNRRYKTTSVFGTALLNFREGRMTFGLPRLSFQSNPFGKRALNLNVNLINVEL